MSVVALRLAGPLQSWGAGSRFVRRSTEMAPTKSGIIGMVAAAKGIRRTDPLEELLDLRIGVRIDQPGQLIRDFQTAQRPERARDGTTTWKSMPLSYRYYIADAVFLAVLEGDLELINGIDEAVRRPEFALYLGRRSCPPAGPIALGVFDDDIAGSLATLPWLASQHYQRKHRERLVRLATLTDANADEVGAEATRDTPVSFDPSRRIYTWRFVVRDTVDIPNPHGVTEATGEHDPMASLGG